MTAMYRGLSAILTVFYDSRVVLVVIETVLPGMTIKYAFVHTTMRTVATISQWYELFRYFDIQLFNDYIIIGL